MRNVDLRNKSYKEFLVKTESRAKKLFLTFFFN